MGMTAGWSSVLRLACPTLPVHSKEDRLFGFVVEMASRRFVYCLYGIEDLIRQELRWDAESRNDETNHIVTGSSRVVIEYHLAESMTMAEDQAANCFEGVIRVILEAIPEAKFPRESGPQLRLP
ncbi:hypothetical protein BO94DRAFT_544536 [Aspergillus sclerotioniger CBS 115572]|uniref:Uncharacterized protein n=1 Tax=Aspergillus sclerotioniger CBS 115572 TaxID=1450535 RepID=A0A317X2U8_9EURO|nr:hypothetical protein BO94DRAFT_544536 [Aspergillus sclerotioniger CBS 115572]PWY91827.1 hypothetical protein BO94DRAFT_544536 [Aspergillus sclerotioniger CBS 115572]